MTDRDADEWNIAPRADPARAGDGPAHAEAALRRERLSTLGRRTRRTIATLGTRRYWRADGEPARTDASLFADEQHPDGHTSADASAVTTLASELARRPRAGRLRRRPVLLWRERQLPGTWITTRLKDELERDRLRRVFTQGLDAVAGYALPIQRVGGRDGSWVTGPWFLRSERLYLVPGDSPMGLRLPLDSLPWSLPEERVSIEELDPFAPRDPLAAPGRPDDPQSSAARQDGRGPADPTHQSRALGSGGNTGRLEDAADRPLSRGESAGRVVRSALCVEPRGGVLYIFMPPVETVDDYLNLVAAVEATARRLGTRVMLEGYPPPGDPRLAHFLVTPDPGVIEVNIQPARTWDQLVEQTTSLYDDARHAGLAPEKFMADGRHTGTGGGNHFVLGGPAAADSPFLRRPDLLRSLISYWHNHPSLSYLFSGLFLGPTSQAPRVDEARNDSLYELEIAFSRFAAPEIPTPPWFVDRALRHLLIDVTGNTHRAEFCIDKMYSPDTASGRRGLLELRAFEMPPDARMSCAQQLLIRALIARFWNEPYTANLTRWGTELHDRFMLPFFVALDFDDVIEELNRAGYAFATEWFAPHLEFRFPLAGELSAHAIHLTLRQALEPWHVLGEEGGSGGTARYVDSSLERLEVLVSGLTGDRFVVTCNARPIPLHSTGRNGEFVAGVASRAWQPPSALHPTIPVNTPLTFDIVDTWMERSVAGCQYHVSHPGGRNPEQFPVNSYEAESRRLARFTRLAHTPGRVCTGRPERTLEFPYTLDLRTRP